MKKKMKQIAVLIPCYNEASTIASVVDDFTQAIPNATIYVYDNNSTDHTAEIAAEHGAVVRYEPRQGKGQVARQMLRDIDADCYLMVDGDSTYPATQAQELVNPILAGEMDMVSGDRLSNNTYQKENKRVFHNLGNALVCKLIRLLYGVHFKDVMTGYRAFSRAFAKTYPVLSSGFELETEITIHTIDKSWRWKEIPIHYQDRPEGSTSKLSTFTDGYKVLKTIASLFKDYKPLAFFGTLSLINLIIAGCLGVPVIYDYFQTGLVLRFPTALLATGLVLLSCLFLACGLILDTIIKAHRRQWEIDVYDAFQTKDN